MSNIVLGFLGFEKDIMNETQAPPLQSWHPWEQGSINQTVVPTMELPTVLRTCVEPQKACDQKSQGCKNRGLLKEYQQVSDL